MTDLFQTPIPLRVVLHVNLWTGGGRFDWDGLCQNPDTGDVLHMVACPARLRPSLGPELARMLLWTQAALTLDGDPESALEL